MAHPVLDAEAVLRRLPSLPGGPELLAQAARRDDVSLVGGAVRDLLLGHWPRELDVTVARDAAGLARALAESISPSERAYGHRVEPVLYERFGTASVRWEYGRVDIAELRAERYPAPGALPEVRAGTVAEDLARRDFTVNAIGLPLSGEGAGALRAVPHALEDLRAGRLRVLHEASFDDDPTRLLRMARYAARVGFEIDPRTLGLAREALAGGALVTVSGDRTAAELALAATEPDPIGAFASMDALGILAALGLPTPFDRELAEAATGLLPRDGSRATLALAVAFHPAEPDPAALARARASIERLTTDGVTRDRVSEAALGCVALAPVLVTRSPAPPSLLREVFADGRPELVAMVGALAGRTSAAAVADARRWLGELRRVELLITGEDLIAAGIPEGPEIGRRLDATLDRKLDGELADSREAELRAALAPAAVRRAAVREGSG